MHVPHGVIRPHTSKPSPSAERLSPAPASTAPARWVASATLPTQFGEFQTHVFLCVDEEGVEQEHVALVCGEIDGGESVPVRVHSECLTSEVFGSLKCDCKEQLDTALAEVARLGCGAVLYLRQEGRGIGLANKIRAYALQSRGHDTVDANRLLGLPDDARKYDVAADMLKHFGVKSVRLMTNNPEKVSGLRALGVKVTGRTPVIIAPNPFSAGYLETKRARMAHELPAPLAPADDAAE